MSGLLDHRLWFKRWISMASLWTRKVFRLKILDSFTRIFELTRQPRMERVADEDSWLKIPWRRVLWQKSATEFTINPISKWKESVWTGLAECATTFGRAKRFRKFFHCKQVGEIWASINGESYTDGWKWTAYAKWLWSKILKFENFKVNPARKSWPKKFPALFDTLTYRGGAFFFGRKMEDFIGFLWKS